RLARECGATRIVWNRLYEPAALARDRRIETELHASGFETQSFNASLLHEPWTVETRSGGPFQVFTAFWRHCKSLDDPPAALPEPRAIASPAAWPDSQRLDELHLLPRIDWAREFPSAWTPGSAGAHRALAHFLRESLESYDTRRDFPGESGT